jgi:type IV secretory pathway TrbD component
MPNCLHGTNKTLNGLHGTIKMLNGTLCGIFANQVFSVHCAPHKSLGMWGVEWTENPWVAKMAERFARKDWNTKRFAGTIFWCCSTLQDLYVNGYHRLNTTNV